MQAVTTKETWQRLVDYGDAAAQDAWATALMAGDSPLPHPILRWYIAERPALIRGVFQPQEEINLEACARHDIPVIRRRSGGTAVLVGARFLSLDIALPPGHPLAPPDVTAAYRWLGEAWLAAVRALGVRDARLVTVEEVRARPYQPVRHPVPGAPVSDEALVRRACFGSLSPYEVAVGPRKLVGLSQVRRRPGVLFQVGLPLVWEADLLADLLAHDDPERARLQALLRARALGLADVLDPVPLAAEVMAAFEAVLTAFTLPPRWAGD